MKHFLVGVFILTHSVFLAQISDDFSDGDFTAAPAWNGTGGNYIVNPSFQLQLNDTIANTSYLSTTHGLATLDDKEWSFWTRQAFAPSGNNYGRVYLTADNADLSTDPNGFYVQLGEAGTNDAVQLFKCDGGVHTMLVAGPPAQIASSFSIGVRVVRDNTGTWSLYIDGAGGTNYALEGTVNDPVNLLGSHFGVYDVYTVSNATDFYYDDIYVGDEILDTIPPVLLSATPVTSTAIDVTFDEDLDIVSAETIANYTLTPSVSIAAANLDGVDQKLVHLTLATPLTNGMNYTLETDQIADLALNNSGLQAVNFTYLVSDSVVPGDVILNEFMCDPSPPVSLPEAEFVEIYNVSNKTFNVQNWQLGDNTSTGTIQTAWLMPGDYMVLTTTATTSLFVGATAVTSFPGLNNAGDDIVLRDANGVVLDSISYTDDWYHDPSKADGGYSIERINPSSICNGETNWAASNYGLGGTPGQINSIYDSTPDTLPPSIAEVLAFAPNEIEIHFTEAMDSLSLTNAVKITSPTLTLQTELIPTAFPTLMNISFMEPITPSTVYTIELQNVADCWSNMATISGDFVLLDDPMEGELVINEIMFNPLTGGSDWIEVYNNSNELYDAFGWEIANYDNDTIDNHKTVNQHFYIQPGEYLVFAKDTLEILQNYPEYTHGRFIEMDLPNYNDSEGTAYIIANSNVVDALTYSKEWHFALIDDLNGKTLERIDPDAATNDANNWHTAAEAFGFATPGKKNSQNRPVTENGEFSFTSETVSPDNDGFEDVLQVNYQLSEAGLVADFTIYDDRGRKIATVLEAELMAESGTFVWDGIRDDNTKASIGAYVAVFEAFGLDGSVVFAKRKAFVVAGKL